jgi:ABC-type multidrug transport system fused ATPase/permease subunit
VAAKTLGVLIFDVIERVPQVRNSSNPSSRITLTRAINFTNVTFKYPTSLPEHKPVLIDASFSIKAGEATAIVGPSGSGKSTIVQLIERFYDPRAGGRIDFDGKDIKDLELKCLRENIGYVSQEPIMIMGTIRDNLLYGNKDATEQDCIEALMQANAGFVKEQENGLDTFVGTAGIMNMSGG